MTPPPPTPDVPARAVQISRMTFIATVAREILIHSVTIPANLGLFLDAFATAFRNHPSSVRGGMVVEVRDVLGFVHDVFGTDRIRNEFASPNRAPFRKGLEIRDAVARSLIELFQDDDVEEPEPAIALPREAQLGRRLYVRELERVGQHHFRLRVERLGASSGLFQGHVEIADEQTTSGNPLTAERIDADANETIMLDPDDAAWLSRSLVELLKS